MFSTHSVLMSMLLALSASTSVVAIGVPGHSHAVRHHRAHQIKRGNPNPSETPLMHKRALKKRSRRSCKARTSSTPSSAVASATAAALANAAADPSDEDTSTAIIQTAITATASISTSHTVTPTKSRFITVSSAPAPTSTPLPDDDDDTETTSTDDDTEPTSTAVTIKSAPTSKPASTVATSSSSSATKTSSEAAPAATTKASSGGSSSGSGDAKPSNWPSATQKSAAAVATVTSTSDPFLAELSKSYNNQGNALYTQKYTGAMTYYGQGLGACGDTYDDSSYTAAVSKLLYDTWPGASSAQNLNPICGPFVPGRKTINNAGQFVSAAVAHSDGKNYALIGGDGHINCDAVSQCHIPLTATVKHGGKSIIVKIVDRCEGCAMGDIDLTPTAFKALADPALGRTDVEWYFNQY